ncbi:MAG: M48 family metallopeptidase [Thermodesulfobacteriota bacterium]|nr:MAG: M48 family metallopeptidase [Thermodesulfobacteriota bacterium]
MAQKLILILAVYLLLSAFDYLLDYLNVRSLKRAPETVPPEFEETADRDFPSRARRYFLENFKFALLDSLFNKVLIILFLFTGIMNGFNSWIASMDLSFTVKGLLFFLILFFIKFALEIPLSYYRTFRIESNFGFNAAHKTLWFTDLLKSLLISTVIIAALVSSGLYIVEKSPGLWWLWIWLLLSLFVVVMIYVSPYVIEPLFNKFTPLEDETLATGLKNLAERAGIKVAKVFRMDASTRTRHTNAYFTGVGRTKRIVLYDTLLKGLNGAEVLAIVAHEAGHWKKKHIFKQIVLTGVVTLVVLYISWKLFRLGVLTELFNIESPTFFSNVVIMGFLLSMAALPTGAFFNYISRKREREADLFASRLTGDRSAMIKALAKLSVDNLSNLHPHPLYVFFNYSHPPVLDRIRYIKEGLPDKSVHGKNTYVLGHK